jgi:hypothetical protein
MKSSRKLVPSRLFFFVLLAACQINTVANAQNTLFQGKFRLEDETHWSKAVLPAGEYSLTIESTKDGTLFALVRSMDGKETSAAMATALGKAESGGSYLFIVNDRRRRVRLLNLPDLNFSLTFGPLSKSDNEEMNAVKRKLSPVVIAEK